MNIPNCIQYLLPNAQFGMTDISDYSTIQWCDERQQPTLQECEDIWSIVQFKASVPQSITPAQLRVWLIQNDIDLTSIDTIIDAIQDAKTKAIVRARWEYSLTIERNNILVATIAADLSMTDEQVDNAFIEAALL